MFTGDTNENPNTLGAQAAWDATMTDKIVRCPACQTILKGDGDKTAEQQLSASGHFCEECVLKQCGTAKSRHDYLMKRGLYGKFLDWAHGNYWMYQFDPKSSSYKEWEHNDAMYLFMEQNEYDHPYFVWLMETN
jgi:hypothetical protein